MRDLYKRALVKIEDELDIRHINTELRTLRFIANIILDKHQRQMIPYFKEHVLHNSGGEDSGGKESEEFKTSLCKSIDRCGVEKMDRRILKNIDIEDN